jgi:hypothetical protein
MTVKFAPVGPLGTMNYLLEKGVPVVGDYHLLLAHEVLANQAGWNLWANQVRIAHDRCGLSEPTFIMDTSVIELGMPMTANEILRAARTIRAQVLVLPDIIGDKEATHSQVEDYFTMLDTVDDEHIPLYHMFVPQGTSLPEYLDSLEWACQATDLINWIGLPRDALQFDGITSRRTLIDACSVIMPGVPIHLLGMSDNILDDVLSCRHSPVIMGLDSAVPIRAGLKHMQLKLSVNDYGKRGNYWDTIVDGSNGILPIVNMQWFREAIQPI